MGDTDKLRPILEEAFNGMVEDYDAMLSEYYPAHGKNGLTEANQTFYFVKNLLECLSRSAAEPASKRPFCWMEAPLQGGRIDCFVVLPSAEAVLYIEAKRLSLKAKVQSFCRDLSRLTDVASRSHVRNNYAQGFAEYVVGLADIWVTPGGSNGKGKWRQSLLSWWQGNEGGAVRADLSGKVCDWMDTTFPPSGRLSSPVKEMQRHSKWPYHLLLAQTRIGV